MSSSSPLSRFIYAALVTSLAACGGGGGGGDNTSGNNAPVATADSFTAQFNATITIDAATGVLSNDTDADADTLNATPSTQPSNGILNLSGDGSFTYTHDGSATTSDSFTYVASDGNGGLDTATVTLTINSPPVASLFCDNSSINANFNGDLATVVSDPDGDSNFGFSLVSGPTNGNNVTLDATGQFTYEPDDDFRGTDIFTYTVDDLNGGVTTGTVQLIVGETRIMPLGDSLTRGTGEDGGEPTEDPAPGNRKGYREFLYEELTSNGFAVDFVGTWAEGSGFDNDHEGHGGIRADEIAMGDLDPPGQGTSVPLPPPDDEIFFPGIRNALNDLNNGNIADSNNTPPPDIILLHIGTNDIAPPNSESPGQIAGDINNILAEIQAYEDSPTGNPITVILARIVGNRDTDPLTTNDLVQQTAVNDAIVDMAQTRIDDGDNIIIVNMEGLTTAANIFNDTSGLHLTEEGYEAMADIWLRPLTGTLGTITGTQTGNSLGAFDPATDTPLLDVCPSS